MSGAFPSPAEGALLRFLVPLGSLRVRWLLAGTLFAAGLALWCLVPPVRLLGLLLVLLGHLPLWVRTQTTAPGGATPEHEEIWAPVDDDWAQRLEALEERGRRWDTTPWDLTNRVGCGVVLGVLAAIAGGTFVAGLVSGGDGASLFGIGAGALLLPLWLNGARTTWNPSELRLKAEALNTALEVLAHESPKDLQPVPMLAFREGRRGRYPVDAKLMLRPETDDGSGFLGIQFQVALNNVQGKDYPYLYAVILGRSGYTLPHARPHSGRGHGILTERGSEGEVDYLVVRRHADRSGGWHTDRKQIQRITRVALAEARRAGELNAPQGETS